MGFGPSRRVGRDTRIQAHRGMPMIGSGERLMQRCTDTDRCGCLSGYASERRLRCRTISFMILLMVFGAGAVQAGWPQVVPSEDGALVSFEVCGRGEPTLIFVHGWCCDARYWRAQVPHFAKRHRVVTLDLAGHGHSGATRSQYSMSAFGQDVRAVTEAVGANRAILVGHSMGGAVIAEAARLMPKRVIGLIGVDTLENIEYPMTPEGVTNMLAPLKKDFRRGSRAFVEAMMLPGMAPRLREWILADMSAAPPAAALSALNGLMSQYITGEAARVFDEIPVPVVCVNSDMWPINYEANRRHMSSFDALILKGADHFLMLDRPEVFNRSLEKAIDQILKQAAGEHNGVTAHRGNSAEFPENTIAAFKSALSLGSDWIELDIHTTADGQVVVIHDVDTRRVGDRNFQVSQVTYQELKSVDVAHDFRKRKKLTLDECPPATVPLLSDVIRLVMQQDRVRVSIQPKTDCVRQAVAIVKELKAEKWVGFNDGSLRKMKEVKRYAKSIPVFWDRPGNSDIDKDLQIAREEGFESLVLYHEGVTRAKVDKIHQGGLEAGAWTVNDAERMQVLLAMGIERIYTDNPRRLLQLLEDR